MTIGSAIGSTIGSTLAGHALRSPQGAAAVCDGNVLTWAQVLEQRDRLAASIDAVAPGASVALHLRNAPGFLPLFLAVIATGREAQILDPDWPIDMAQAIVGKTQPALLITGSTQLRHPRQAQTPSLHPETSDLIAALALLAPKKASAPLSLSDLSPFYVGFTSGSTGLPKGYRRHHRSWLESFAAEQTEFDITREDVILAPGTMTHSLFLYAAAHAAHLGATALLSRAFRPDRIVEQAHDHGATIIYGVPSQLRLLAQAAIAGTVDLNLRWILSSGAKLGDSDHALLQQAFPRAQVAEFYGASELSFVAVRKASEAAPATSVGRAFRSVDLSVRDAAGKLLPHGETGLVYAASPMLFSGYATQDDTSLLRSGEALSVGDVGRLDARGFLHLLGRADRMIVSSGKNISPEIIETALERHAAVEQAAVIAQPDPARGLRLVALVKPLAAVTSAQLIGHCRPLLPLSHIPRLFFKVEDWPMTRSGKSDFAALKRRFEAGAMERLP